MKILAKVTLVSAMAISANAMAMQAMDDESLSSTTGQDGITIKLAPTGTGNDIIASDVVIHDRGGFEGVGSFTRGTSGATPTFAGLGAASTTAGTNGALNGNDGAIVLDGFKITSTSADKNIVVTVDADSGVGGTAPVLNVNVGLPQQLTVETGKVYVAKSGGINNTAALQYDDASKAEILDNTAISLNGASLNIQLGNQPQGALIALSSTVTGGLTIGNLNILQGAQATAANGGIGIGKLNITNANDNTKWDLNAKINAKSTGLEVSGLGSVDLRMENVRLGNLSGLTAANAQLSGTAPSTAPKALGQVALLGLALPNVTISGH